MPEHFAGQNAQAKVRGQAIALHQRDASDPSRRKINQRKRNKY